MYFTLLFDIQYYFNILVILNIGPQVFAKAKFI